MSKINIVLIKLGGSLITFKTDEKLISEYLDEVQNYIRGESSFKQISSRISNLMDFARLEQILDILADYQRNNKENRIVLIHGAGSVGHSLVRFLIERYNGIQRHYSLVKLAVSIQNQIVVSKAIQHGINAVSFASHGMIIGQESSAVSTKMGDAHDLFVFEEILLRSPSVIPVFYGDVGLTASGWKVFSGDIIPAVLSRSLKRSSISKAVFLTKVKGKKTGIYTTDPSNPNAKFINEVRVYPEKTRYLTSEGIDVEFDNDSISSKFDVTGAMSGKLQNILELVRGNTTCWVVGVEDFGEALEGKQVGTVIRLSREFKHYITLYGIGDAFGSGGYNSAALYLNLDSKGILLDCGPQSMSSLKAAGRTTEDIDLILITHFHGDHIGGLPFLLLEAKLRQQRHKDLLIIGPQGIDEIVRAWFKLSYSSLSNEPTSFQLKFLSMGKDEVFNHEGLIIRAFKMNHTREALGYRLEYDNSSIAYTGDTGWTDELINLVKDTDLSVVECSFFDKKIETHLSYHEILRLLPLTKHIVVTHLGDDVIANVSKLKQKNLTIPCEGQTIWF